MPCRTRTFIFTSCPGRRGRRSGLSWDAGRTSTESTSSQNLRVLKVINEDKRPMMIVFHLHGELLMGDWGSRIVELAASWAIILLLTGVVLWWPRDAKGVGGVVYPRFGRGGRVFWRDLHAVTGIWVSGFALFLLVTGLPWAGSWGKYLEKVRALTNTASNPDWTVGPASEAAARAARNPAGLHVGHAMGSPGGAPPISYAALNKMVATVDPLHLADPVLIAPPVRSGEPWTAKSDAQNRTLRTSLQLDSAGTVSRREDFSQQQWIDRWVETGVAAHEGHLFGFANQLLGLFTAICLVVLTISALVLWWRRRPSKVLGAPIYLAPEKPLAFSFVLVLVIFCVYLPLLGASILAVRVVEFLVLRRIPATRKWLGLASA